MGRLLPNLGPVPRFLIEFCYYLSYKRKNLHWVTKNGSKWLTNYKTAPFYWSGTGPRLLPNLGPVPWSAGPVPLIWDRSCWIVFIFIIEIFDYLDIWLLRYQNSGWQFIFIWYFKMLKYLNIWILIIEYLLYWILIYLI